MHTVSRNATAFGHYWRVLGRAIYTTIAGFGVTLKYLFSRPVTVEYPYALPEIPDGWRGLHAFENDRCTKCRLCESICPIQCITIETEGKGKKAVLLKYEVDYGKCLFCNLCAEVCPTECLWLSEEWDLACYSRGGIVLRLDDRDPEQERKKLWPSMKGSPARQKKKKEDEADREKPAPKAKPTAAREPREPAWERSTETEPKPAPTEAKQPETEAKPQEREE